MNVLNCPETQFYSRRVGLISPALLYPKHLVKCQPGSRNPAGDLYQHTYYTVAKQSVSLLVFQRWPQGYCLQSLNLTPERIWQRLCPVKGMLLGNIGASLWKRWRIACLVGGTQMALRASYTWTGQCLLVYWWFSLTHLGPKEMEGFQRSGWFSPGLSRQVDRNCSCTWHKQSFPLLCFLDP